MADTTSSIELGFIGFGNMAQAMAQGLVDSGALSGEHIHACAGHFDKLQASAEKLSTIPNTPIAVGAGVIACEQRHSLTDEQLQTFENLFGRIALIEWVDGKLLSTASSIAGCGPAFAAMFLESLGDAGV